MICTDEKMISDEEVKDLDAVYSSWGDTVHYSKTLKFSEDVKDHICMIPKMYLIWIYR